MFFNNFHPKYLMDHLSSGLKVQPLIGFGVHCPLPELDGTARGFIIHLVWINRSNLTCLNNMGGLVTILYTCRHVVLPDTEEHVPTFWPGPRRGPPTATKSDFLSCRRRDPIGKGKRAGCNGVIVVVFSS